MASHEVDISINIINRKEIFSRHQHLAPIEHLIIGSTAEVDGEHFGTADYFGLLKTGQPIDSRFFMPPAVIEKGHSGIDSVNEIRKPIRLGGLLNCFTLDQADLMIANPSLVPSFFPGELKQDGQIANKFMVGIVDTKTGEITRPDLLDKLILNETFAEFYKIRRVEDYILIVLKEENEI